MKTDQELFDLGNQLYWMMEHGEISKLISTLRALEAGAICGQIIPPYDMGAGPAASPMGMPMCQNRMAVPTWSYAMEKFPPSQIIELGSLNGGFTTALAFHAWQIDCKVFSFDLCKAPNEDWQELATFLGVNFIQANLMERIEEIEALVKRPGTTYLLCDNGDKVAEFIMFSGFLKPGDVIAAHDYCCDGGSRWWTCSEIKLEDVSGLAKIHNLEPFFQPHFDTAGWLAFRKKMD